MNKSDYDKYYKKGGTYVIPIEVFNELFNELERLSFNYEQALEDLDKKENIIKEVRHYIKDTKQDGYKLVWIDKDNNYFESGIEEILEKENSNEIKN